MSDDAKHEVGFWVNGDRHDVADVDPRTLLLDYLRSDAVALTGTKKVCAQGGCGACTVTLSRWNDGEQRIEQIAVNSCLRPLCAIDGMAVTTVEGVGSIATGLSPVQHRIAVDNGSQCGYCTPGWVMSMHSFLIANEDRDITQEKIEELFDGNLCRCTGYRSILYAMRHFATGWGSSDEANSMTCLPISTALVKVADREPNPIPDGIRRPPVGLRIEKHGYLWLRVLTLPELLTVLDELGSVDDLKLVAGNTSIGVYGEPAQDVMCGPPHVRVDISSLAELHGFDTTGDGFAVGAATTYSEFIGHLDTLLVDAGSARRRGLEAVRYMAHRTAGRIVRDAASLAGNTMLVVRHVRGTEIPPFPSDMFTALCMMDASVRVVRPSWAVPHALKMLEFAELWQRDDELQRGGVIVGYDVPFTREGEWARTFKVAQREVNSHSIVNAGMRVRFVDHRVVEASVVFGGIGPIAFHAATVEQSLVGQAWTGETLSAALAAIRVEVTRRLAETAARMAMVPDEGFTDEYRIELAEGFFYEFFLWVAGGVEPPVPAAPEVRSAGDRTPRPVSRGTQKFSTYADEYPVSQPVVKAEAFIQATGEAVYTHDTPTAGSGLEAALVVSTQALKRFAFQVVGPEGGHPCPAGPEDLVEALRSRFPGFVDLVTAKDIPGENNQAGMSYPDDPLICDEVTTACGQVLAIVVAEEHQQAIDIAWWVQTHGIAYTPIVEHGQTMAPIYSLEDAMAQKRYLKEAGFDVKSIERPGSDLSWIGKDVVEIDGVECRVVRGSQASRTPQMHFYLETQSAVVTPAADGRMSVLCSTQNPDTIHTAVAGALGLSSNQVDVQIVRVGGGYGGKGPRSPWAAANAAVAAAKLRRPVKLAVTRETDSALFGHASPLLGEYEIAISTGRDESGHVDRHDHGRLLGMSAQIYLDAGSTADCTPVVMDCVQLRFDNGYLIPHYRTTGEVCLTNTISNTSFRSLDAISGITVLEDGIEAAAYQLGILPEDVRAKNLYRIGDATPYGEVLSYCYLKDVWEYTKKISAFEQRLVEVQQFNRHHRWVKRGISMIPIKYGMGFNAAFMERGDALVEIYGDGSVLVRHGGAEIGQGLNTQVIQLVAQALNVPMDRIRVGTTSTSVIPNPESTGASTGAAFNGGAALAAAKVLRQRLEEFCVAKLSTQGRKFCAQNHLDFWSYDEGWRAGVAGRQESMWDMIVQAASQARIDLSAQAQHDETGGTRSDTGLLNSLGGDPGAQEFRRLHLQRRVHRGRSEHPDR